MRPHNNYRIVSPERKLERASDKLARHKKAGPPKRIWTDEEKEEICFFWMNGFGEQQIAEAYHSSHYTINNILIEAGLKY